jgi:hypothetical protein
MKFAAKDRDICRGSNSQPSFAAAGLYDRNDNVMLRNENILAVSSAQY